jgi:hypothetical protein
MVIVNNRNLLDLPPTIWAVHIFMNTFENIHMLTFYREGRLYDIGYPQP